METDLKAVLFKTRSGYECRSVSTSGVGYGGTVEEALSDMERAATMALRVSKDEGIPFVVEPDCFLQGLIDKVERGLPIPSGAVGCATFRVFGAGDETVAIEFRSRDIELE